MRTISGVYKLAPVQVVHDQCGDEYRHAHRVCCGLFRFYLEPEKLEPLQQFVDESAQELTVDAGPVIHLSNQLFAIGPEDIHRRLSLLRGKQPSQVVVEKHVAARIRFLDECRNPCPVALERALHGKRSNWAYNVRFF